VPVPDEPLEIDEKRVDHSTEDLLTLARKHGAEEIVVAMDDRRRSFPLRELLDCKFSGINVVDIVAFLERESGKVSVDVMAPSYMIFSEGFTPRSSRAGLLRLF
jgi:hypothetical protein